jgi:hypothetical protein
MNGFVTNFSVIFLVWPDDSACSFFIITAVVRENRPDDL